MAVERIDYTELKFPMRPFVILKKHSLENKNTFNTNDWKSDSENLLKVPYNYLKSFKFSSSTSADGGAWGEIVLFDPYIGKITDFVISIQENYFGLFDVLWGWQIESDDLAGNAKVAGEGTTMQMLKLDAHFVNGGMEYKVGFAFVGCAEMHMTMVTQDMVKGCFADKKMTPMQLLKKLVENYNIKQKDEADFKEIVLQTNIEKEYGPIDDVIAKEKKWTQQREYIVGNNKSFARFAMELVKKTKVDQAFLDHPQLLTGIHPKDRSKILLYVKWLKNESEGVFGVLSTLYKDAMYYCSKNERGNVLNMDMQYNEWLSILGTSFKSGSTNKRTGEHAMVRSQQNREKMFGVANDKGSKKQEDQAGNDSAVLYPMDVAETSIMDDFSSPEQTQQWLNNLQDKMRMMIVQGSITVLGDPNIYNPYEHVYTKYVQLMVMGNEQPVTAKEGSDAVYKPAPNPFYSGKYQVLSWEHNMTGGKWVTKLNLCSLFQPSKNVTDKYKERDLVANKVPVPSSNQAKG